MYLLLPFQHLPLSFSVSYTLHILILFSVHVTLLKMHLSFLILFLMLFYIFILELEGADFTGGAFKFSHARIEELVKSHIKEYINKV